ncbi:hypothetical protein BC831DRAFT_298810 [Entophlyctis helioformis]|nr:hypothetical protein BC831DRAFT_298810 [Entophlyctis helioformis]
MNRSCLLVLLVQTLVQTLLQTPFQKLFQIRLLRSWFPDSSTMSTTATIAASTPATAPARAEQQLDGPLPPARSRSRWDTLPVELHDLILGHAGALTQFLNGRFPPTPPLPTCRQIWIDVFRLDWPGDLALLPQGGHHLSDLRLVASRTMYDRLCARFPYSRYFFRHIAYRMCWIELIDMARPRSVASMALRHGYLPLLAHMVDSGLVRLGDLRVYKSDYVEDEYSYAVVDKAAEFGHVHVAAWLIERGAQPPLSSRGLDAAARNGHLDILVWMLQHHPAVRCTAAAMDYAARYGHTRIVEWLHENGAACTGLAGEWAARFGHWDTLLALVRVRPETHTLDTIRQIVRCGCVHSPVSPLSSSSSSSPSSSSSSSRPSSRHQRSWDPCPSHCHQKICFRKP